MTPFDRLWAEMTPEEKMEEIQWQATATSEEIARAEKLTKAWYAYIDKAKADKERVHQMIAEWKEKKRVADLTARQRQIRGCRKTCTTDTHEAGCTSNDAVIGRADPELAAQKQLAMRQWRAKHGDPMSRIKPDFIEPTVGGGTFIGVSPKESVQEIAQQGIDKIEAVQGKGGWIQSAGFNIPYFSRESKFQARGEGPLGEYPRKPFPLPKVKAPTWKAWLGWKLIKLGRKLTEPT